MENNEETISAEIPETVPAEETRDDLDDLPVKKDEELFFDNTDFQIMTKTRTITEDFSPLRHSC